MAVLEVRCKAELFRLFPSSRLEVLEQQDVMGPGEAAADGGGRGQRQGGIHREKQFSQENGPWQGEKEGKKGGHSAAKAWLPPTCSITLDRICVM